MEIVNKLLLSISANYKLGLRERYDGFYSVSANKLGESGSML